RIRRRLRGVAVRGRAGAPASGRTSSTRATVGGARSCFVLVVSMLAIGAGSARDSVAIVRMDFRAPTWNPPQSAGMKRRSMLRDNSGNTPPCAHNPIPLLVIHDPTRSRTHPQPARPTVALLRAERARCRYRLLRRWLPVRRLYA